MVFPGRDFEHITPEQAGISSAAITRALRTIDRDGMEIHSMLIVKGGKLAFEHYFAPYTEKTNHAMFSCSKTFTSMLIGIAQGKGLLKITDKVVDFFPDVEIDRPNGYVDEMTIRDLLVMGSGHSEDTFDNMMDAADGDWARVFLNQAVDHKPGTHFVYNTGATYMLSAILTRVTGKNAFELAHEWIFDYIGADPDRWECCPKGIAMGGTGLYAKSTDMARFGILIANEGVWNGMQVIPAEYIREAREAQISNAGHSDDPNWTCGYCYQMWRCSFGAFRADGLGGQFIVMFPGSDLLFVFTSGLGIDNGYPLKLVGDILLPACKDAPLPDDPAGYAELMHECDRTAPVSGMVFGVKYAVEGDFIDAIMFNEDSIIMEQGGEEYVLPYGWGAYRVSECVTDLFSYEKRPVAAKAEMRGGRPEFHLNAFTEPFSITVRPTFEGDTLTLWACHCMTHEPTILKGKKA